MDEEYPIIKCYPSPLCIQKKIKNKNIVPCILRRLDEDSEWRDGIALIRNQNLLSCLYLVLEQYVQAEKHCEEALRLDNNSIMALKNKAYLLLQQHTNILEVQRICEKLNVLSNQEDLVLLAESEVAYAYSRLGPDNYVEYVSMLKKVIQTIDKMDKENISFWKTAKCLFVFGIGLIEKRCLNLAVTADTEKNEITRERYKEVTHIFFEVLKYEDKDSNTIRICKARSLISIANLVHSAQINKMLFPQKEIDILPADTKLRFSNVIEYIHRAIELCPNDDYVLGRSGQLLRYLRHVDQSIEHLTRAIQVKETSFNLHHLALSLKARIEIECGHHSGRGRGRGSNRGHQNQQRHFSQRYPNQHSRRGHGSNRGRQNHNAYWTNGDTHRYPSPAYQQPPFPPRYYSGRGRGSNRGLQNYNADWTKEDTHRYPRPAYQQRPFPPRYPNQHNWTIPWCEIPILQNPNNYQRWYQNSEMTLRHTLDMAPIPRFASDRYLSHQRQPVRNSMRTRRNIFGSQVSGNRTSDKNQNTVPNMPDHSTDKKAVNSIDMIVDGLTNMNVSTEQTNSDTLNMGLVSLDSGYRSHMSEDRLSSISTEASKKQTEINAKDCNFKQTTTERLQTQIPVRNEEIKYDATCILNSQNPTANLHTTETSNNLSAHTPHKERPCKVTQTDAQNDRHVPRTPSTETDAEATEIPSPSKDQKSLISMIKCPLKILSIKADQYNVQINDILGHLQKAYELGPNAPAYYDKGLIYRQIGQTDHALTVFLELIRTGSANRCSMLTLSRSYEQAAFCLKDKMETEQTDASSVMKLESDCKHYLKRALELQSIIVGRVPCLQNCWNAPSTLKDIILNKTDTPRKELLKELAFLYEKIKCYGQGIEVLVELQNILNSNDKDYVNVLLKQIEICMKANRYSDASVVLNIIRCLPDAKRLISKEIYVSVHIESVLEAVCLGEENIARLKMKNTLKFCQKVKRDLDNSNEEVDNDSDEMDNWFDIFLLCDEDIESTIRPLIAVLNSIGISTSVNHDDVQHGSQLISGACAVIEASRYFVVITGSDEKPKGRFDMYANIIRTTVTEREHGGLVVVKTHDSAYVPSVVKDIPSVVIAMDQLVGADITQHKNVQAAVKHLLKTLLIQKQTDN